MVFGFGKKLDLDKDGKREALMKALAEIEDETLGEPITDAGFVDAVSGEKGHANVHLKLPTLAWRGKDALVEAVKAKAAGVMGDVEVVVHTTSDVQPATGQSFDKQAIEGIRNVVLIASGKGGVGKSTVAVNLAISLARQGYRVGLVDTDIYGPSIPVMMGVEDAKPRVNDERRIIPVEQYGVKLLSMGFLVDPEKAVIWRGPMVSSAIRQFLGEAEWGDLDFLIMDLPPGTGDIQLTIVQTVPLAGAIIVSTPQKVALADARKGIAMFGQVEVPVVGIVENMAWFEPPDAPGKRYFLFGKGGAAALAEKAGVDLIGQIPLQESVREACDAGKPSAAMGGPVAEQFDTLARNAARAVFRRTATMPASQKIEILYK